MLRLGSIVLIAVLLAACGRRAAGAAREVRRKQPPPASHDVPSTQDRAMSAHGRSEAPTPKRAARRQPDERVSFARRGGALACEGVPLADMQARFGTPTYVYSRPRSSAPSRLHRRAPRRRRWSATREGDSNSPSSTCWPRRQRLRHRIRRRTARVIAAGGEPAKWCSPAWARRSRDRQRLSRRHPVLQPRVGAELEMVERVAAAPAGAHASRCA